MIQLLQNIGIGLLLTASKILPGFTPVTAALVIGVFDEWLIFIKEVTDYLVYSILRLLGKSIQQVAPHVTLPSSLARWSMILATCCLSTFFLIPYLRSFVSIPQATATAISFGAILAIGIIPLNELANQRRWFHYAIALLSFGTFFSLFSQKSFVDINPGAFSYALGGFLTPLTVLLPGMKFSFFLERFGVMAITGSSSVVFGAYTLAALATAIGIFVFFQAIYWAQQRYRPIFLSVYAGITWASLSLVWPFYNIKTGLALYPWDVRLPFFTQQLIAISISFGIVSLIRVILENSPLLGKSFGIPERVKINP